ncbi:MAG: glycosyltransferase [bacterium]|nr:glycosyltransferase [bacterium]
MADKVSVIIATKNEEGDIGRCIKSVKNQTLQSAETIVVDNHSTDQTSKIARYFGAKVFQAGPERSAQRNFGAQKATGKFLLFLDADMELEENILSECSKLAKSGKEAIIISEKVSSAGFWDKCRALEKSCYLGDELIEAARFYKKGLFLRLNGYDEQLIASEDWDLHQRAKKIGAKVGRTKNFVIHHVRENSPLSAAGKKYYYGRTLAQYVKKHPGLAFAQYQPFRMAFIRNFRKLVAHPLLSFGLFVLKFAEYFGGGLGFIRGKLD